MSTDVDTYRPCDACVDVDAPSRAGARQGPGPPGQSVQSDTAHRPGDASRCILRFEREGRPCTLGPSSELLWRGGRLEDERADDISMTTLPVTFSDVLADCLLELTLHMPGHDQMAAIASARPSSVELERTLMRVGKNDAPRLLAAIAARSFVDPGNGVIVGSVWCDADYPERYLPRSEWRDLFSISGYTEDSIATARPPGPLRLYRGAVEEHHDGWSWTDDVEVARTYASGEHYGRGLGWLWTAVVDPERLLCRNSFRDESEYVVETTGLAIDLMVE